MNILLTVLFLISTFTFMWSSLNVAIIAAMLMSNNYEINRRDITVNILYASMSFAGIMAYLFIW